MNLIDLKDCTMTIKDGSTVQESISILIGEGNLTWSEKRNIEYKTDRGSLATGAVREGDQVPVDVSFEFVWNYIKGIRSVVNTGIKTAESETAGAVDIDCDTTGTTVANGTKFVIAGDTVIHTIATGTTTTNLIFTPGLGSNVNNQAAITFFGTPSVGDAIKKTGEAAAWISTDTDTAQPFAVNVQITNIPSSSTVDKETMVFSDFRYESLEHDPKAGSISCTGKCNIVAPTVTREGQ